MGFFTKTNSYLDHASGSILYKQVSRLLLRNIKNGQYNPASSHSLGLASRVILENSRETIAKNINAHNDEIIFTGSATESIALAILGTVFAAKDFYSLPHVITSTIEHSAVIETCKILESRSLAEVTYLTPDENGMISSEILKENIKENTVLVTFSLVNGEIGTISPVEEYLKILNKIKEEKYGLASIRLTNKSYYPYLHLDAAQGYVHLDLGEFVRKGVDLITFNSVKTGGPSGIAALFKRRSAHILNIYGGGEQEFGIRPGSVSSVLASGFALASSITKENRIKNESKYIYLKDYLIKEINKLKQESGIDFIENSNQYSIPSIINISFPYFKGEQLAIELDARGVCVSSKSACKNKDSNESYVIGEIRKKNQNKSYDNYGSIRISFGPNTEKKDIIKLINALKDIISTYRGVLY